MRILLVSSSSGSRGGGEIFLLYLGEALKSLGHTVALWAARHPRMDELAQRFSVLGEVLRDDYANTYDRWHRGLLPIGNRTAARLIERWMSWRPDIVHFNKQNLEDGNDFLALGAQLAVPNLCTVHITQTAKFLRARFATWRDARACRALRGYRRPLVTVAAARKAELQHFLGDASNIHVVLNGVPPITTPSTDRAQLRAHESLAADAFAIVAVGRLEAQKCPLRFLRHATRIRQQRPAVQLRWFGSGRLTAAWDRAIDALDLHSAVTRIDWRRDVRTALPAFDLFLHTAAYEGLPLALLEAMEAALPCVVEHEVHAQLPPELQACSLVLRDEMDWPTLLDQRDRLSDLGAHARSVVRAQFSAITMAEAYERLYTKLCGKN